VAQGPCYQQAWEGMIQTTPIIPGGTKALRLPAFCENLGHSNVILTDGVGSFGHNNVPKQGAMYCRHGDEACNSWNTDTYGDVSLSDGVVEHAMTHEEIKRAATAAGFGEMLGDYCPVSDVAQHSRIALGIHGATAELNKLPLAFNAAEKIYKE